MSTYDEHTTQLPVKTLKTQESFLVDILNRPSIDESSSSSTASASGDNTHTIPCFFDFGKNDLAGYYGC